MGGGGMRSEGTDRPTAFWVDVTTGETARDKQLDLTIDAVSYKLECAMAEIEKTFCTGLDRQASRELAASLLASTALKLHRTHHPDAHRTMLRQCLDLHPDLEPERRILQNGLERAWSAVRALRRQLLALYAIAVLLTLACIAALFALP